ncbi:MAG TPA: hypothetical protein VFW20_08120 [Candidatus Limnocylindrales bacterium]|nr:hypothetical protein [Candidatus Limnocylindrales bacterium]
MEAVHHAIAAVVAGLALVVAALAAFGLWRGRLALAWIDRAILGLELVILLGIATGLARFLQTGGPADGLHPLYAIVALGALPVARFWRGIGPPPSAVWLLIAGLVVAGVTVRLVQTG